MRIEIRAAVVTLALGSGIACTAPGEKEPDLEVNSSWSEPAITRIGRSMRIDNNSPRAFLDVSRVSARVAGAQLLFWGDQAPAHDAAGNQYVAETENHEVLIFDSELKFQGALLPQSAEGDRLRRPLTLTADRDDRLAAFEASGGILVFDRWGRQFTRIEEPPFTYNVGAWAPDSRLVLARSPYSLAFAAEAPNAALLATLDPTRPQEVGGVGHVRESLTPFLVHAANAGSVAADRDGNIYYAALGRSEVSKFDRYGALVWSSERVVDFDTPEPRLVPSRDGPAKLVLTTVQKSITLGPDGLLYIRAAANADASADRLDVLSTTNGAWLASASVDTGTAILLGPQGAAFQVELSALLEARTRERRDFRSFVLGTFDGGSLSLEDLAGSVKLVTFWASWCGPCREELPLLDSLSRAIDREDFRVVGINEDINEKDARAFAGELGLSFTNLLGRGEMRSRYHYSGLPYSALIDRHGQVVKEYYGFGGREAFDTQVAARIMSELGPADSQAAIGAQGHDHDAHDGSADSGTADEPNLPHHHGATRPVHGDEMEKLAAYYPEAAASRPETAADVPEAHWEMVKDGLALVDSEVDTFMERFPGTLSLIRLMALKTQLHVDVEGLPSSTASGEAFEEVWRNHLESIHYFLEIYHEISAPPEDAAS